MKKLSDLPCRGGRRPRSHALRKGLVGDRPPVDLREGIVDADEAQVGVDQSKAHRCSCADDVEEGAGLARGHVIGNLTCAAVVDLTNTALAKLRTLLEAP